MHFIKKIKAKYRVVEAAAADRYLQMFKGNEETARPIVDWCLEKLKRQDRIIWFLKNWKKDAKKAEEAKTELAHYVSEEGRLETIKNLKMDANWDLDKGLRELKNAESAVTPTQIKKDRLVKTSDTPEAKRVLDCSDGWAWWEFPDGMIEKDSHPEREAMQNCGNTADWVEGDQYLSLRKEVGKDYVKPVAHFVLHDGILGEMKGFNNKKPDKQYHPQILKLLYSPLVKHVWGSGYNEEQNFNALDLTPEEQKQLIEKKGEKFVLTGTLDNIKLKSKKFDFTKHNEKIDVLKKDAGVNKLTPEILDEIALNGKTEDARKFAVQRVTDQDILKKAVFTPKAYSPYGSVGYYAVTRIKDQDFLKTVATNNKLSGMIRIAAARQITDEDFLKATLQAHKEWNMRIILIEQTKDKEILEHALKDKNKEVRNEAKLRLANFKD